MNNIKHLWTIICKNSIIDKNTNNLSLFEIIERFNIEVNTNPPAGKSVSLNNLRITLPEQIKLITTWVDYKEKNTWRFSTKIEFVSPQGKNLGSTIINSSGKKTSPFHRTILTIQKLPIEEQGIYKFKISLKQKEHFVKVAEIPIEVLINKRSINST